MATAAGDREQQMSGSSEVGGLEDEGSGSPAPRPAAGRRRPSRSLRSGLSERVGAVLDGLDDAVLVLDSEARPIYANRRAQRVLGLAPTDLGAARTLQDLVPGLQKAGMAEALRRVRATRTPVDFTVQLGATPRPYAARLYSTPAGLALTLRDGGPRPELPQPLEAMLAASASLPPVLEARDSIRHVARALVPALADACAIAVLDETGTRLVLGGAAARDRSIARLLEEVVERTSLEKPHWKWLRRTIRSGEPLLVGCIEAERLALEAQDDQEYADFLRRLRPCSVMLVPLIARGRRVGGLALVSRDGSRSYDETDLSSALQIAQHLALALDNMRLHAEMQDANRRLRAERDRLARIFDVFPEGVLLVDRAGVHRITNAAASAILGTELLGQPLGADLAPGCESRYPDGSRIPTDELPLHRALRRQEATHGEQLLVRRVQDGREIALLVNAAPLMDEDGALAGGVLVFQDVTDIQALGQQKDIFLRTVSHDLKNRLNAATGWVQVLERRLGRIEEGDRSRFTPGFQALSTNLERLGAMVDELVDLTRLQLGRPLPLRRSSGDLVAMVRSIADEQQQSTDAHMIRVEAAEPSVVGEWDLPRVERVVTNLVSNAIKYSPAGGDVVVSVERTEDEAGVWAVVRVRDQGIGIPAEDRARVFQLYQRGSNVGERIEGTGLGLTGARQIVEQHGGAIEVESEEGRGSTFTVRLPA